MKKTLFLLAALGVTSGAHAAVGDTLNLVVANDYSMNGFIADGVKGQNGYFYGGEFTSDVRTATRFYDSTKGWAKGYDANNNANDSRMCWAHTASNMIQYWQSYYGVFYKGNYGELPYGSDYTRTLQSSMSGGSAVTIDDPMRLNVAHKILNYYQYNDAGKVCDATNYYFTWAEDSGGYFSEYFGAVRPGQANKENQTAIVTEISDLNCFTNALLTALGISKDGSVYTQTEAGLIAHLNISDGSNSHTLTCYGLTLDENGNIKTIVYADSDDNKLNTVYADGRVPVLSTAYVVEEDGAVYLCNKTWNSETSSFELTHIYDAAYFVGGVTYINTPEVLQNMLAEYSDVANEAQVWNGNSNEWKAQVATTEELPTESTGWDVLVDGDNIAEEHRDYYHTYSTDGRAVVFDAHGMNGRTSTQTITVSGTVTPGAITVENGGDYHLKAGTGADIAGTGDVAVNNGGKLSSELNFGTRAIKVASGGHFAYAMTADTVLRGQISGEEGSVVQFRNGSVSDGVTYSAAESYDVRNNTVASIKGTLVVGDAADTCATKVDFSAVHNGYLTVENLVLYENSSLNTASSTKVMGTYSSLRGLQSAATFSVRAAATAPVLNDSLDLTEAHTLVMETATNLNSNKLLLFTSNSLTLQMELSELEDNVLFTNVSAVMVDGSDTTVTTWDATTFFSGENMQNYDLVFVNGNVSLVYAPMVPEPATATLSLLALAALTMRRRRK